MKNAIPMFWLTGENKSGKVHGMNQRKASNFSFFGFTGFAFTGRESFGLAGNEG
jgi:hypothetical protein